MTFVSTRSCNFPANEASLCRGYPIHGVIPALAPGHRAFICADNFVSDAIHANLACINPCDTMAKPPHLIHLVADEDNSASSLRHIPHFPQTFFLEIDIAYGQNFIYQQ